MKSPFPGMDPYLELRWADVHATLIAGIRRALQPQLPADLRARIEQDIFVEGDVDPRRYRPDIHVVEGPAGSWERQATQAATTTLEPVTVRRLMKPAQKHRWIEVVDGSNGERVITVIELLSPTNKAAGRGSQEYIRKLNDFEDAGVSVVEIDLIRWPGRERMEYSGLDLPPELRHPYLIGIRRGWMPESWKVYSVPMQQKLPGIPIPLRKGEPEPSIELQPLLDEAYVEGRHADLDYSKPLDPPLEGDDAAWARELLEKARKR